MTRADIIELLEALDGDGLVITDWDAINDALDRMGYGEKDRTKD